MLSCAAIQKLERYGQLGLKRNGIEDFVRSSLKDPKRASVYALTHMPTWQECLDAIRATGSGGPARASVLVTVTDSLIHAASFTVALVAHHLFCEHVDQQQQQQHAAGAQTPPLPPHEAVFPVDATAGTSQPPLTRATALVSLMKRVLVGMAREGDRPARGGGESEDPAASYGGLGVGGVRLAESKELLSALMHLLDTTSALLLYALTVRLSALGTRAAGVAAEAAAMWQDGLVLLAAALRLLRRVAASQQAARSEEPLFTTRTAAALVKQFISRHQQQQQQQQQSAGKVRGDAQRASEAASPPWQPHYPPTTTLLESYPLLQVLLRYTSVVAGSAAVGRPLPGSVALFENFSTLQRLSLVDAAIAEVGRLEDSLPRAGRVGIEVADATAVVVDASAAQARRAVRLVEGGVRRLLRDLLAPSACNRATRHVVYFRGDDLKLIQSRVSQPAQYALHTFTTTPPVDPALISTITSVTSHATDSADDGKADPLWREQQHAFYGMVWAQWIVSVPLFFDAFCRNPSWTVFAQEQRRMALLRQAQERRSRREDRPRRKPARRRDGSESDGSADSAGEGSGSEGEGGADDTASMRSAASTRLSVAPSLETSRSMLSLESRASLLSTLSKQSVATYMSFLSVLRPTGDVDGEGGAGEPKFHESADGNTNLPLILLEELILGLHRFMESVPADSLDRLGLRALCWQAIGQLFHSLQRSLAQGGSAAGEGGGNAAAAAAAAAVVGGSTRLSDPTTADPPLALFHLGADLRYNQGLGYESLGLLFAKVIAPQFEGGVGVGTVDLTAPPTPALPACRATLAPTDPPSTRRSVESALSQCLAAYETVAPQVVDSHLSVILRMAARTVAAAEQGPALGAARRRAERPSRPRLEAARATSPTATVLYDFLAGVVRRLGRSNQLPLLLDALVHSATTTTTAGALAGAKADDVDDTTALQVVFSHSACRAALVEASGLAMDPETVLARLLAYVADWTSTDVVDTAKGGGAAGEGLSHGAGAPRRDAAHVQFVLALTAAVLEGVHPTSMTSSAVLDRSAELELVLTAFAQRHLLLTEDAESEGPGAASRAGGGGECFFGAPLRPKLRRQLWLHTLYALYQCRELTQAALRDLGLQNVRDYLAVLNDTLWRVDRHAGALLLSPDADDKDEGEEEEEESARAKETSDEPAARRGQAVLSVAGGAGFTDLAAQLSASTCMALPPHAHVRTLLPRLALQRLCLVRAVTTVLDTAPQPLAELRRLAQLVLETIREDCTGDAAGEDEVGVVERVLGFVDAMSEEDWAALAAYGKRKHLRATLVALLRRTFAATAARSAPASTSTPVWLTRCLRTAGGTALRAMTDIVLSYTTEEVVALAAVGASHADARPDDCVDAAAADAAAAAEASSESPDSTAARELVAMLSALSYTYATVGHVPYWPVLADRASAWLDAILPTAPHEHTSTKTSRKGKRQGWRADPVTEALLGFLARCLAYEAEAGDVLRRVLLRTEALEVTNTAAAAAVAAPRGRGVSRRFLEDVGVLAAAEADDEDGGEPEDELSSFPAELQGLADRLFDARRGTQPLLELALAADGTSRSGPATAAVRIVAFTYHTALTTVRAACREGRYHKSGVRLATCTAIRTLRTLAEYFRATIAAQPRVGAVLADFLRELRELPGGAAGLTALPPHVRGRTSAADRKEPTDADERQESAMAAANAVEKVWVATLRAAVGAAVAAKPVTAALLDGMVVLYETLVSSTGRPHKGGLHGNSTTPTVHGEGTSATPLTGLLARVEDGAGSTLRDDLESLFAPALDEDALAQEALTRLAAIAFPVATDEPTVTGVRALWVLLSLFTESVGRGGRGEPAAAVSRSAQVATATALVTTFLAHGPAYAHARAGASAAPGAADAVLAAAAQTLRHNRGPQRRDSALSSTQGTSATATVAEGQGEAFRFTNAALRASTDALALLPAAATPRALPAYVLATLTAAVGTTAEALLTSRSGVRRGSDAGEEDRPWQAKDSYHHLTDVAATLRRLAELPATVSASTGAAARGGVPTLLRAPLLSLLSMAAGPACLAATAAAARRTPTLHEHILATLRAPAVAAAMATDAVVLDAAWAYLSLLLSESYRSATMTRTVPAAGSTRAHTARFRLSQDEIMGTLALLTSTWLPSEAVWQRTAQLPPLISAVLEAVLLGVRDGRYERRVLSQLARLLHELVRLGVDAVEESEGGVAGAAETGQGEVDAGEEEEEQSPAVGSGAGRPPTMAAAAPCVDHEGHPRGHHTATTRALVASYPTRLLCLTAMLAEVFQVARHHVAVFTTFSADLDYIARDVLRVLSRVHLPQRRGTPIAFHAGVQIRPAAPSPTTFADLVYTCVGDEEGRALLRQAALRLEEEVEYQGSGGRAEGLVERRRIFNVEE